MLVNVFTRKLFMTGVLMIVFSVLTVVGMTFVSSSVFALVSVGMFVFVSFIQAGLSAHVVKSGHIYFIKTLTLSSCLPLICLASREAADRFVLLTRRYLPFRINYAKMKEARQP